MLTGKTAVITGASRGIGKAIALQMAKAGADIAVIYASSDQAAQDTVKEIEQLGRRAKAYRCNVASFDETKATVSEILKDFGRVDILVNNAGITKDGLVLSMSEGNFDAVVDTNLKGAFNMIRHLYGNFLKARGGRIINISSVAGIAGNAGQANYSSAKAGLIGLTKAVARELAGRNVTCNAIAPGFITTDMTGAINKDILEKAIETIPLKRMGEPEDVAQMAVFLAGEGGRYITGEVIKIDGGLCM